MSHILEEKMFTSEPHIDGGGFLPERQMLGGRRLPVRHMMLEEKVFTGEIHIGGESVYQ